MFEPIEGSWLVRASCTGCGAVALACEEKAPEALCGTCWTARTGAGAAYTGGYTVPVGYPAGTVIEERAVAMRGLAGVPRAGAWTGSLRGMTGPVCSLAADAMGEGWVVRLRPAGDSWAVRGETEGACFLAVHRGSTWGSLWAWGGGGRMLKLPGLTVLREWIAWRGRVPACWYVGVRTGEVMAGLKAEWLKVKAKEDGRGAQGKRKEAGG